MDNICYATLDKFKHVTPSFRRFVDFDYKIPNYVYAYDVIVKTFDTYSNAYDFHHYAAFKRNTSTNWRDILLDYTQKIEDCINNNWSLDKIYNMFSLTPENYTGVHYIAMLTEDSIQDIINKNIVAFNRLNSYINDLLLLKDMGL